MKLAFGVDKPDKHGAILRTKGEIDLDNSQTLKNKITELVDLGNELIVLDLGEVTFIDSSGISMLVSSLKMAAESDCELQLAALKPSVFKVLQLTGVDRVFVICDSPQDSFS